MRQKAFRFGSLLGCKATTSQDLKECLMTRPAGQMADTQRYFQVSQQFVIKKFYFNYNLQTKLHCFHYKTFIFQSVIY